LTERSKLVNLRNFLIPTSILFILIILNITGLSSELIKIIFWLPDQYNSHILKSVVSILIYVIGASTIIPISILNYFMGIVFGYPIGIFLALLCNFLSCTIAYWIFKYLNVSINKNNSVDLDRHGRVIKSKINFSFANAIVKIAYACLILPFSVIVSTVTSLKNIGFKTYIAGMLLGTAPSCLTYSFLGTLNIKANPSLVIIFSVLSVFLLTLPIVFRRTFPVFTKKNKDTKEKYKAP
jgi:uncharacterized membrane protein YdjX (TVP38/TMEM64 family)